MIIDSPFYRRLLAACIDSPLRRRLLKRINKYLKLPLNTEVALNTGAYPSYAYCVYHAAQLARRLHLDAMSVIEFGVAGGNGLVFLERFGGRVEKELGVQVQVYGFDSGKGLPEVTLPEDLPYWFQAAQYTMDVAALESTLRVAKVILGNVRDTLDEFFSRYNPAPVGAILNDLDLYSSTLDSLEVFEHDPRSFLPRVFLYFDDIVGSELEMYSDCNGQLRAISEFNGRQNAVHIGRNHNLIPQSQFSYRYQIYYAHLKSHPLYGKYIGGAEQANFQSQAHLRSNR